MNEVLNMRKLIALTLAAAALMPAAASAAVSRGELQRDRQDIREERRELRDAQRYGSPRDVREERGEYRDAKREYREDMQDWRHRYRGNDRAFRGDRWNGNSGYTAFRPGWQVKRDFYGSRYQLANPGRYGLPPAYGANRWIRHHDDALLVNLRSGQVVRVIRNVW
jgi:Ni/Co efflux regulator RcnB